MDRDGKRWRDNAVAGDYVGLSPVATSIVDTPPFQRLRYLKQLGTTEYVYANATHTRFAHSIGVAHRAKEFARRLKRRQPELLLSDSDLLVLEVAGLCHDLGHGPFSHSFESELLPKLLPPGTRWEHEEMGCRVFDHICSTYQIGLTAEQQARVRDLIVGDPGKASADWSGREWQMDVVANKRNGLDVDKLDYIRRDNLACGELTTSEFSALYENMRVIGGQVCFRSNMRSAVLDVYAARARLHEFVYTHPVAKAVEYMVTDALEKVAAELGIVDALADVERFALLDDTVVREIERSSSRSKGMQEAQELMRRLRVRDIYKHCGSVDIPQSQVLSFPKVAAPEILAFQDASLLGTDEAGGERRLAEADVRVHNLKIDYTCQHESPLTRVGFYHNDTDADSFTFAESPFAPGTFITRQVRVYLVRLCGNTEEKRRYHTAVQAAFQRWSKRVLGGELVASPQKSTVTASARKRKRPSSSQQDGAAPSGSTAPAPSGGMAGQPDDGQGAACSQSAPPPAAAQTEPPAKQSLAARLAAAS